MNLGAPTSFNQFWIITNRPQAGFFSSFIQVIGELHYCEQNNVIPVVFFSDNWLYWQRGGYRGAINGWEYYFSPVSTASISELTGKDENYLERCNIFDFDNARIIPNKNPSHYYDLSRRSHIKLPGNVTVVNKWPDFHLGTGFLLEENRMKTCDLISQYIRIRPGILERVEHYYSNFMAGKFVVGVHFRGAEHRVEVEKWHGLEYAKENAYFTEIDRVFYSNPEAYIYVATDTVSTLQLFVERYGDRCLYYESRRSMRNNSPHKEFGGAEIGEEILIETILLSRADFMVHGISNVAFAALGFNPRMPHVDVYQREHHQ